LRVTIGYYDTNNALLSEITLDTAAVMPAPSSTALIDTINGLTGTLTPTALSVGMQVSLSTADVTTLASSGLDVAYQWQQGTLGGSWNDITDAELSSYSAQNSDVGSALTLCLTLTDASLGQSQSVCTDPTNIVTDNASGYTLRTLYLRLDSSTDTLSLINDSQVWLNNLLTTENLSASYQWYRVPESGSVDSGGTTTGSATSSYADYVLTADDDNYRHALRVTLSNGDEVNSDLSSEWGGAGSSGTNTDGTFQDLYVDMVRIEGGATPYVVGDTLTARMSGSTASNSQIPDSVNYQWQQFN
ncbi:hypothetical protein, partial [Aliivibrio finisterrensis]|uniref:hypothetical protein n=1 Tax=Aliivibrio finisterrensis TaxID=511998 RepID=UPI00142ECF22